MECGLLLDSAIMIYKDKLLHNSYIISQSLVKGQKWGFWVDCIKR